MDSSINIRVGSAYVLRNGDVIDILSEEEGIGFWGRSKNRYHVPGRVYLGSEQHFWRLNGNFLHWYKNHPLDIVSTEYSNWGIDGYRETLYVKECDRPLNHHNSDTRVL